MLNRRGVRFFIIILLVAVVEAVSAVATRDIYFEIAVLFLSICLVGFHSLVRSASWIWRRGSDYTAALQGLSAEERTRLADPEFELEMLHSVYTLDEVRGEFFPFGVRGVVIDVWRHRYFRRTKLGRLVTATIYFLWKYYIFAPVFSISLFTISYALPVHSMTLPTRALFFLGSWIIVAGALSVAVEAALSYLTFGSWSVGYHRFDIQPERSVTEMSVLVGGVFSAFVSIAATTSLVSVAYRQFDEISSSESVLGGIGRAIYYTFTSLTANGDAGPDGPAAFLLVATTYTISAAFLIIVVSLLLDSVSDDFKAKIAGRRTGTTSDPDSGSAA